MNAPTIAHREKLFVLTLAVFYLGLAICWQDVSFYDELFYMDSGARFHWGTLLHSLSFAPLYALWYRTLQFICSPPVWRYFLSWSLLSAMLITLPLWIKLRSAWLYAWLLVCVPFFGPTNLSIRPHIVLFAAAILLGGMGIVLARRMDFAAAAFTAFVFCFVTAFARPEFAYSAGVAAVVYFGVSWAEYRHAGVAPWKRWVVTACMLLVLIHVVRHSEMMRSGVAFAQHYNIRAQAQHKLPPEVDAWSSTYALEAFHLDPTGTAAKTSTTISMFARANPRLFTRQIIGNLFSRITVIGGLVLIAALVWPWRKQGLCAIRPASLYLLLVAVAPCAGILLIYPERHYFVSLCPVLLVYVAEMVFAEMTVTTTRTHARYLPWLLAIGIPVVLLKTVGWPSLLQGKLRLPHPQIETIQCLRDLDRSAPRRNALMYEAIGVPAVFLPTPRVLTETWDIKDWVAFSNWVDTSRPGWVEVTPLVPRFYGVPPAELESLMRRDGYTPHPCPASAPNAPLLIYVAPDPKPSKAR